MIEIGNYNRLCVVGLVDQGAYLDGGEKGEVFLPRKHFAKGSVREGAYMQVFVTRDVSGELVATTQRPLAMRGEFAALKVVEVKTDLGAFLAWGLQKDLLLPAEEMEFPVQPEQVVVVYVFLDPTSDRIFATTRLRDHVSPLPPPFEVGQPVNLMVVRETPLGYIALVEGSHLGLLYQSSVATRLEPGQKVLGYIGAVRDDGKIDLTLDSSGAHRVNSLTEEILAALAAAGGKLEIDDASPPEVIREAFGASKKAFKQAVGSLYKQRLISLTRPGIALISQPTVLKKRGERFPTGSWE